MMNILEVVSTFTPSDGSAPRTITIRISDLREEPDGLWSVAVDVLGFKTDDHVRLKGADCPMDCDRRRRQCSS